MWYDPISARANEEGCSSCGTKTTSCYAVEFSLFPRRLVRKKHRDRHQTVLFCRPCYEADDKLEILVDGAPVAVAKKGIEVELGLACLHCCQPFFPGKALYGFLSSSCWMSGSCIESLALASFCPDCVEKMTIELAAKA